MFTLVVFTLVTGIGVERLVRRTRSTSTTSAAGSRCARAPSARRRSTTWPAALRATPGVDAADFTAVGSQSVLAVEAKQVGTRAARPRRTSSAASTRRSSSTRRSASASIAQRLRVASRRSGTRSRTTPGLAVVDSTIVPRRDNWNFGVAARLHAQRLLLRGGRVRPDPGRGARQADRATHARLTVIGILKDTAPLEMVGISTSQQTLAAAFPGRVRADDPLLRRSRPASTRTTRPRGSSRRSSRTGSRPSRSSRSSTTRSRRT